MSEPIPEPPAFRGCLWPVDTGCLGDEWAELDPEAQQRALALSSATLRRLTGYRVGGCPVTVRPCTPRCYIPSFVPFSGSHGDWMQPGINTAGYWVNSCGCSGSCSCTSACEIALPGPVGAIEEIKVDGDVIDPSDYTIQGTAVVWVGAGDCPFPAAQDLSLPDSLPGTFSITYLNAHPVDSLGAQAAALLAIEFARACKPKGKCSLPRNVTEVVRNGVSFTIEAGLFPQGRTGIDVVDAFVELWNPEGRIAPSTVWTPTSTKMRTV